MDLIEELNNAFDEKDIPQHKLQEYRKTPLFRLIGLITIVSFIAIFVGNYFKDNWLPPLNFLSQSGELKQLPEVQAFQEAVVMIDTVKSNLIKASLHNYYYRKL